MRFVGEIKNGEKKIIKIICGICYGFVDPEKASERGYCPECDSLYRQVIKTEQVH